MAVTLGSFVPVGYNMGVINAPAKHMQNWSNQTLIDRYGSYLSSGELETLWSATVSIFLIGAAIGSLCGSWTADNFGRKKSFLICGVLFIIASLCFVFCRTIIAIEILIIGRFIVGLASGLTTTTVPLYLSELAPLENRGQFGVLSSIGITAGIVVGQVLSLDVVLGSSGLWEYSLSFYGILVVICLIPYWKYPESPKYLYVIVGDKERAQKELKILRGSKTDIKEEIKLMDEEIHLFTKKRSFWSIIVDPTLLLPLVLVCAIQGGQQLSGINAVFYNSVQMFESAGLSSSDAQYANLGCGLVNCLVACFNTILLTKFNRRTILLTSCLVASAFLCILTVVVSLVEQVSWFSYASIAIIFGYTIFFQIGLGPIPYFIGCELFEIGPRSAAMALGSLSSWICNFIVAMSFPALQSLWGAFVFLPFAAICLILAALIQRYLPETRGRDVIEIAPLISNGFKSKIK